MSRMELPFVADFGAAVCDHGPRCSLKSVLPKALQEACETSPFLADYLHLVPIDQIGVPDYYKKLSRDMSDLENVNLIYPIEAGNFVHLYPDKVAARNHYIPIEPHLTINLDKIIPQVELKLLDWVELIGNQRGQTGRFTARD